MLKKKIEKNSLWNENYITYLHPLEKLLFVYCLTNPYMNNQGLYHISFKKILINTGLTEAQIKEYFKKFEHDNKIKYFENWIAVKDIQNYKITELNKQLVRDTFFTSAPKEIISWHLKIN